MPLFSRFGRAFNEMGAHLKTAPIVADFKKAGVLGAAASVATDYTSSAIGAGMHWAVHNQEAAFAAGAGGRLARLRAMTATPAVRGTLIGAGIGGAADIFHGDKDRRFRHTWQGIGIGSTAGLGYQMLRHGGNNMRTMRGLPDAFMKGFRA